MDTGLDQFKRHDDTLVERHDDALKAIHEWMDTVEDEKPEYIGELPSTVEELKVAILECDDVRCHRAAIALKTEVVRIGMLPETPSLDYVSPAAFFLVLYFRNRVAEIKPDDTSNPKNIIEISSHHETVEEAVDVVKGWTDVLGETHSEYASIIREILTRFKEALAGDDPKEVQRRAAAISEAIGLVVDSESGIPDIKDALFASLYIRSRFRSVEVIEVQGDHSIPNVAVF